MSKLLLIILSSVLLVSCRKDDKIVLPGPESVVRYKLNGNLVEIRGSLLYSNVGSQLDEEVRKEGRSSRVYSHFRARNSTEIFDFHKVDFLRTVNFIDPSNPNTADYISASFSSGQYKLEGPLGISNTNGFTLIVDRRSDIPIDGRLYGTIDGRFYGTGINTYNGDSSLVNITDGEFINVWVIPK